MKIETRCCPVLLSLLFSVALISCDSDDDDSALSLVSNTNFEASEAFSVEVPVTNHALFSLTAVNGDISISGDSGTNAVIVSGVKRVLSESLADAETNLQLLSVSVQDLATEVRVDTIQPSDSGGRSFIVDYTVTLPRRLENRIAGLNGNIVLDEISNDVSVLNLNGNVALVGVSGSATVSLLNGSITGDVALPLNGMIDMEILNGDIDLAIPVNTSAEFSASVTIGSIAISNLVLQNEFSTSTFLSGTLGTGQGTIVLEAKEFGNISVTGI